jgi:hypothetical protein
VAIEQEPRAVLSASDEALIERRVGPRAFSRGRVYANGGAVVEWAWTGDDRIEGQVRGGGTRPYRTWVRLTRRDGHLRAINGACTCPVGVDCKHVVALLLHAARPSATTTPPAAPRRSDRLALVPEARRVTGAPAAPPAEGARWDRALRGVLSGVAAPPDVAPVGLQFELVGPPKVAKGTDRPVTGLRVRPVTRGRSGAWVRQGVSWASIADRWQAERVAGTPGRRARLQELLALSRLGSSPRPYAQRDEVVSLEAFASRRVWDLLAELRDIGVPLVTSGREGHPVHLAPTPAVATLDVRRPGKQIVLQPCITVGGETVSDASCLWIGTPAHGIAWWAGGPGTGGPLHLAAFDTPVDDAIRDLLGAGPVQVPRQSEARLWRELYLPLCRRFAVTSSDDSVELPSPRPATLSLAVTHHGGHRLELAWAAVGGWRHDPWSAAPGPATAEESTLIGRTVAIIGAAEELIERTPFGERPVATVALEDMSALRFVTDVLPLLEDVDGVDVDQRGEVPDYREAEAEPVIHLDGAAPGDADWFDLTVSVTVEGEEVPFGELFTALATGQSHLILPSGTYFSLDRPDLRRLAELIAEARSLRDARSDGIRLSRFQSSLWEELAALGVASAQAERWQASVRALNEAAERTDLAAPEGLCAELRPYQLAGFNWLAFLRAHRLGGILADDMGLGKTVQALALMLHTIETGQTTAPYLVVAPTSVVQNWAAECARFAPGLAVVAISEMASRRGTELSAAIAGADVVITSYALFRLEYDAYEAIEWSGLFLDEAQFAKNRYSQAYVRAKQLPAPCKVAMTGTPMENNLMELWSLLSITAPGLFASADRFSEHYRVPIERHDDEERLDRLRRRVRPLLLRRTKEHVASDLPAKQEQVLDLELHPRHQKLYQTYLHRERQKVLGLLEDMDHNRFEIFRSLTLLRQASLDLSLVDAKHARVPSTKLDALTDMLGDIVADGHRVLIFSQFTRFLDLARQRVEAAGIDHCYLDGRTRRRAQVIDRFRSGRAPVFLISLKAGGFGLNLTEADYCVLLDPWWNPATEAQAVDRAHRIGQTRNVMVYRMVASGTIEEKVMALKAKKAALFANVMDAGGLDGGGLTAADIRSLLS